MVSPKWWIYVSFFNCALIYKLNAWAYFKNLWYAILVYFNHISTFWDCYFIPKLKINISDLIKFYPGSNKTYWLSSPNNSSLVATNKNEKINYEHSSKVQISQNYTKRFYKIIWNVNIYDLNIVPNLK